MANLSGNWLGTYVSIPPDYYLHFHYWGVWTVMKKAWVYVCRGDTCTNFPLSSSAPLLNTILRLHPSLIYVPISLKWLFEAYLCLQNCSLLTTISNRWILLERGMLHCLKNRESLI
jgi:hypothetical protein